MRQFRTTSGSGYLRDLWGWLVIAVMSGWPVPVYAQDEEPPREPAQALADETRGSIVSGLGAQKLSQRFPDAALWLDLEDGDRALALFWPEHKPPARGGLIILADEGGNAASGLTGTLARELTQRNFAVLTLGLEAPSIALEPVLERPAAMMNQDAEPDEQSVDVSNPATIDVVASQTTEDVEDVYRARIREQLVAGVAALEGRDYDVVAVLGIGRGSNHIVLNARELGTSLGLIWIGPKFYPRDGEKLATALDGASVTRILELSSSDERDQRRVGLKRARVEGFSLQVMGAGDLLLPQNGKALAGRISAWLKP